jgi:cytochrome d ubiquinol oxidase subunit I
VVSIVLGDESGYMAGEAQKVKLAAIESEWETQSRRQLSLFLAGRTRQRKRHDMRSRYLGCCTDRDALGGHAGQGAQGAESEHEARIVNGIKAYAALQSSKRAIAPLRSRPNSTT